MVLFFDIKIHIVFRAFVQKLMLFGFCGYFHSKNKRQNIQASASTDTILLSMDFLWNCDDLWENNAVAEWNMFSAYTIMDKVSGDITLCCRVPFIHFGLCSFSHPCTLVGNVWNFVNLQKSDDPQK